MRKKLLAFVLAAALLTGLAGCYGGYDDFVLEGLAADLQGTWVGKSSSNEELTIELGFHDDTYHSVIYDDATKVGVLETGTFPRDEWKIKAIADALGVSLDWLFGRE